jgi:nicotinate-nucleotide pyrophosphorylase (carboxylating)
MPASPPDPVVPERLLVEPLVRSALAEDIGTGDATTLATVPDNLTASAVFLAKADGVVCGLDIAALAMELVDPMVRFERLVEDGARVVSGTIVATVEGNARSLLTAERVALNFLQRLSGVATLTRHFVDAVAGTSARIVDTRKTTPGLRVLEKYAVRCGGGSNHRFGLSDGILIKDNHLAAGGGVAACVRAARQQAPHSLRVEVECKTLDQVREAVDCGADILLLDNMGLDQLREAVTMIGGRSVAEASGGVSLKTVAAIASTGVDIISVGALTHSAPALDIALDFASLSR